MGLSKKKEKVFQQNLEEKAVDPGVIFMVHLLMDEMCDMPEKEFMNDIMIKHFGDVNCFCHDKKTAGFAPVKYKVHYKEPDKDIPPQLMIMGCIENQKPVMDEISASQTWDCPESKEILFSCKYQVIATDMMASGLGYKERAEMLVNFIEALVEIFPTCKAVVFETSKKMLSRETIAECQISKESRFIYYAVNVRFFNIQGGNDMLVDSIGMSTLFMPDVQYHFHDIDPNAVVNHAYNTLSYMYDTTNPIKSNDHIDGLENGRMSMNVQWTVRYEQSLVQPIREVLDINTGEFAAGKR
jgi:hypothetical protein